MCAHVSVVCTREVRPGREGCIALESGLGYLGKDVWDSRGLYHGVRGEDTSCGEVSLALWIAYVKANGLLKLV